MTLSLSQAFAVFVLITLAPLLLCWYTLLRRTRRIEEAERRTYACPCCQAEITSTRPRLRLRCPACGAIHERRQLRPS